jgi:translocation and assembly module TamB
MMTRGFRWCGLIVVLSLSLCLAAIVLISSPWGARLSLASAEALFPQLTVDYKSGGLASSLKLSSVKWQQHDLNVTLKDLQLDLDLSCLLNIEVCINSLEVGAITLQGKATPSAAETEQSPSLSNISLPIAINVTRLHLAKMNVVMDDILIADVTDLQLKARFYDSLAIESFNTQALTLDLLSSNQKGSDTPIDWRAWQYSAMQPTPIHIPLAINIEQFTLMNFQLLQAAQLQLALQDIVMRGTLQDDSLDVSTLSLRHDEDSLNAQLSLDLGGKWRHELELDVSLMATQQEKIRAQLHSIGDIDQLNLAVSVDGALVAAAQIQAQLSHSQLPLVAEVTWQDLHWPLKNSAATARYTAKQGELRLRGDLNAYEMTVHSTINAPDMLPAVVDASANVARDAIDFTQFQLITDAGTVSGSGKLNVEPNLRLVAALNLDSINPGKIWPDYPAQINGDLHADFSQLDGAWRGKLSELDIAGEWRNYPLKITGLVELDETTGLVFDNLNVRNGSNLVQLNGSVLSDQTIAVTFSLDAPNLSQSVADLSGQLMVSAQVNGNLKTPHFDYRAVANNVRYADISIEKMQGDGAVLWDKDKPLSLHLNLLNVQGSNNQLDDLTLTLNGNAAKHQLSVDTTGAKTRLRAKIEGSLSDTAWRGQWLEGDIQSSYGNLSLIQTFQIDADWQDNVYEISPHCWQQDSSKLCVKQASFKDNKAQWDLALRDLNFVPMAQRLIPNFPRLVSDSKLSMTLAGQWAPESLPEAQVHISLSPAAWTLPDEANLVMNIESFEAQGVLSEQAVKIESRLSGPQIGMLQMTINGESGDYQQVLERPIKGELSLSHFELAPFRVLLPELDKLQGVVAGQISIEGTLGVPLFNGEVRVKDGAVQGQDIPIQLTKLDQTLVLSGQSAALSGTYQLGKGLGKMQGNIDWQQGLRGQINVGGEALEIDYQSMLRASVTPDLRITFSPELLAIKGNVTVPYARFKLKDLPQGAISPSKDVILVEQKQEEEDKGSAVDINVLVKVDPQQTNQVKLDAFGLTTDVRGTMRLEDGKHGLLAIGDVQLVNGRYRAYGQNLLIREGDIAFNGTLENPTLNIEAVRDPKLTADDVIAGIRVAGSADNPNVEVFSEPLMEQQQSLSYMLTGRGLGESSGEGQDVILANMLLGFGLGKSENIVANIGQKLGFKDVNLDTSGQGSNTQLSLSGYVAPGVQLRYGVGVFDSVTQVAIRYELLPKLYIEAVSGLNNAIDIYYRFSVEGSHNKKVLAASSEKKEN